MNETIANANLNGFDSNVKEKNSLIGKFYSYSNPLHKVTGAAEDTIVFGLYPNTSYYVFVHDEKFILYTFRPTTFPGIKKKFEVKP